ncbi:MAG TPA: YciI family protein [Herpetosiphonaceae bacterium]|nr:YciI family protein [Herpetosiphonaceae bacterium]
MLTYLVRLTIVIDRPTYEPNLPDHFAHLAALKAEGRLLLSGPVTDRTGGFILLRADSPEHAHELARRDPLVERQVVRYDLDEWRITNGDPALIIPS